MLVHYASIHETWLFFMACTTQRSIYTCFLGIDIAKVSLDCWLRPAGAYHRFSNNEAGFTRLEQWLRKSFSPKSGVLICMENTGIYGDRLLRYLTEQGWDCAVVKTTAIRKVAPEHHRKDDRFDAQLLAEYADRYADRLRLSSPPDQLLEELREFYGERQRLIRARTATQNRRQQTGHSLVSSRLLEKTWQEQLEVYNRQIERLEQHMKQLIGGHPELSKAYDRLRGIPGVGRVTAWLWLILFYGQTHLNAKKVASRFGFAPHQHISGSSVRGKTRSAGHGQSQMRTCMAMVARSVSHHDPRFAAYKERKHAEGKPWPVIRNNVINKLIKLICAIWNSGKAYDPEYLSRFDRQKKVAWNLKKS